jgi:DNA-binding transcriptional regulator YiaG
MVEDIGQMVEKKSEKTVKSLRTALNLTQEQFAAKLGVTVSTVNRWENGKGKPSPLARIRIDELWQTFDASKMDGGRE